jgi:L-2-aminoadipate reductase
MANDRLARVVSRLQNLPSISLPTDYPRPSGSRGLVEAAHVVELSDQAALSLLKLALFSENEEEQEDDESTNSNRTPSAFHLLLAAFAVLLHRYTGDTDLLIGSSSASAVDPLLLRIGVDPGDPFWAVVRKVQQVEEEAEADAVPFADIVKALGRDTGSDSEHARPLFRVRFFDETDSHAGDFVRSTSLTSDLTISVTRPPASTHASLAPRISLRILYNSLLFTSRRIEFIIDQLQVFLRRVSSDPLAPVGAVPLLTPTQRKLLPDPTADVDWCGFKGAIPDIFSANARRWPDRPCVIQSYAAAGLDIPQEKWTFTYGTILGAVNTLTHYLIQGGVERGEVVMVYAYRSVELVIAVMAILKVGGTFSVIGKCRSRLNNSWLIFYRSGIPCFPADHLPQRGQAPCFGCTQRCWKDRSHR